MNLYEVYYKPRSKTYKVLPYKIGFSIQAAVFSFFWALYNGMWYLLIIYAIYHYVEIPHHLHSILNMTIAAFFGIFSHEILSLHMRIKGYKLCDVVFADSSITGEYKFYQKLHNTDIKKNNVWHE